MSKDSTEEITTEADLFHKPVKWFGHCIFISISRKLVDFYVRENTDAFIAP